MSFNNLHKTTACFKEKNKMDAVIVSIKKEGEKVYKKYFLQQCKKDRSLTRDEVRAVRRLGFFLVYLTQSLQGASVFVFHLSAVKCFCSCWLGFKEDEDSLTFG